MKAIYVIGAIILARSLLYAQDRRALLIGIDKYNPPKNTAIKFDANRSVYPDLAGCKNDILSIKSVLERRYGFEESNISELQNEKSSRENILSSIEDLLNKSRRSDIAVIYYAGHGSQVQNSKSREADKKDESIVPADIWKEGVYDITDKTLAKYFNKFVDKGVILTVIFDCCHSGSLSRGPVFQKPKFRYLPASDFDTKDASDPQVPEQRKEGTFLIISAAQDNESAQELFDDNNVPHGAFTTALIEAIQQQPADASAIAIFTSLNAILKNSGKSQEPIIGGSLIRQQKTLFGINVSNLPSRILIPVVSVSKDKLQLQGGYTDNLHVGNELTKFSSDEDTVKIKITSVLGINQSEAEILKGNLLRIKPGDLFYITNWVSSEAPLLKLYIPPGDLTYAQLQGYVDLANKLKSNTSIYWMNDFEKKEPDLTVFFINEKGFINSGGTGVTELADASINNLAVIAKGKTIFLDLPMPQKLSVLLNARLAKNNNIALVNNPNDADYIIYGTVNSKGLPSFGLLHPRFALKDSLESLPIQSKHFSLENDNEGSYKNTVDSLYDYCIRLAKVRTWLNMKPPAGSYFPFYLQLINNQNKKPIEHEDKIGDNLSLHLIANNTPNREISSKYVYVFAIDRNGKMQLIYPDASDGNVENNFPKRDNPNGSIIKDVELVNEINITEPAGTDSYFLLATEMALPNYPYLFNQDGIKGLFGSQNNNDPMLKLLNLGNNNDSKGISVDTVTTPSNWNLIRLSVKTKH